MTLPADSGWHVVVAATFAFRKKLEYKASMVNWVQIVLPKAGYV